MKTIAVLLNVTMLCFALFILADEGWPSRGSQVFAFLILLATPIANLLVFAVIGDGIGREGVLGLYLKRKALEERRHIAELNRELDKE